MKVKDFYRNAQCEELTHIESLILKKNKYQVLFDCTKTFCSMLKQGNKPADILSTIQRIMEERYEMEWFSFPWQLGQTIKNDLFCYERFLKWLGTVSIIDANVPTSMEVSYQFPDGSFVLDSEVHLVVQYQNGTYGAICLFFKQADKSPGGKSASTSTACDLHALLAKYSLEREYPNILVSLVYLCNEADTADSMVPELLVCNTKKSNVFTMDFKAYYEESVFQPEYLKSTVETVLQEPMTKACYDCSRKDLCATPSLITREAVRVVEPVPETAYALPAFTSSQLEVVNHKTGPMLVCAGPGSGKTAAIVGRVKTLIDEGVSPETILVITFTNEAAGELLNRCKSFCEEESLPKICTIHALGYEILQKNSDLLEFGVELLSPKDQIQLIREMLAVFPPLSGIKYGQERGRTGFLRTIAGKLDKFMLAESPEVFLQTEKKLGTDFIRFAQAYRDIIRERGFIGFDEQISHANRMFREYPEVLQIYQNLYRYVMVDEFQDVNQDQVDFVYAIAAHENLVCVGDDDQGIYKFRGASNKFMIDFPLAFPDAKVIVFRENFRSTKELVDAGQSLIQKNSERITKNIVAVREKGVRPVVIEGANDEIVVDTIQTCLQHGYHYGDIAILSTKNQPLEDFKKSLPVPCVLARSFLRLDPLFLVTRDILLLYEDIHCEEAFYHLCKMYEIEPMKSSGLTLYQSFLGKYSLPDVHEYAAYDRKEGGNAYQMAKLLSTMFYLLEQNVPARAFATGVAFAVQMEFSHSLDAFLELIDSFRLNSIEELRDYMNYMIAYEDETKVPVEQGDRVLLITSHESKGREFKVVLMLDDYADKTEESRRLFYVAMTRAMDVLYVLKTKKSNETDFISEIGKGV